MSNTAPTPAQSLAQSDYEILTSLAQSVEATLRDRARLADARVTDLAYHASAFARQTQETESFLKAARITGAGGRHAEAYARAVEGDTSAVYRIMLDAIAPVMGG